MICVCVRASAFVCICMCMRVCVFVCVCVSAQHIYFLVYHTGCTPWLNRLGYLCMKY